MRLFFWLKNEKRKFRQGDLIFRLIKQFPKAIKLEEAGDVLIVRGEGSGHHHELKNVKVLRPVVVAERPKIDWSWLVEVPEAGATSIHQGAPADERHPDLPLSRGLYEVVQTREHQNPRPVD